ncbi:MAG: SMP-30/gluconolactonase/LRE family protein [Geminicoccaceae bacterium]
MSVSIEKVLDVRARTGECATWDPASGRLLWVDIPACEFHRFDPANGADETFSMPSMVGCFALAPENGVIVALEEGFHHFDPGTGALAFLTQPEPDRPTNRFNDGTTDPKGRFWAGTMPKQGASQDRGPEGALYCLDTDGSAGRHSTGYFTQNGLAFSPSGDLLYVSDSSPWVRSIWVYDYDLETGSTGDRRLFFDTNAVAGRPDGGTIDADGCYWMAGVGGAQLVRLTPRGDIDRIIDLPVKKPTKIAFGGNDLDVIFVTSIASGDEDDPSGGAIFAVRAGVTGVPSVPYPYRASSDHIS